MAEAIVVADSGPLIALARIGQLDVLRQLAESALVPNAVWEEVTAARPDAPGASAVREARWLKVVAAPPGAVAALSILVDLGEAEAIAIAASHPGSLLLADDGRARRVAERLQVRRMGTVGLLRRAKKAGLLRELRPHLDALQAQGIYIRQAIIDAVLTDVGELAE